MSTTSRSASTAAGLRSKAPVLEIHRPRKHLGAHERDHPEVGQRVEGYEQSARTDGGTKQRTLTSRKTSPDERPRPRAASSGAGSAPCRPAIGRRWHRRGLATVLLAELTTRAHAAGIQHSQASCLSMNRDAIHVLKSLGPTTLGRSDAGLVDLAIDLSERCGHGTAAALGHPHGAASAAARRLNASLGVGPASPDRLLLPRR